MFNAKITESLVANLNQILTSLRCKYSGPMENYISQYFGGGNIISLYY